MGICRYCWTRVTKFGWHLYSFVHSSTAILLGSSTRVLPENQMTDAGEMMQPTFEEVLPGPSHDYIFHPMLKKILDETSLNLLTNVTMDKQGMFQASCQSL